MATFFFSPAQQTADISMLPMSPQATTSCGQLQNAGEILPPALGVPFINGSNGFADFGHAEDAFHTSLFPPEISSTATPLHSQQQQLQFIPTSMMTMLGTPTLCQSSSRLPAGSSYAVGPIQTTVSPSLLHLPGVQGFQYIPSPLQLQTTAAVCGAYEQQQPQQQSQQQQHQEQPQESMFSHMKRQRDENYRYSLGCISRRVKQWLDNSKPFACAAQLSLEDSLVKDAMNGDGIDESLFELFDESRRKRFRR